MTETAPGESKRIMAAGSAYRVLNQDPGSGLWREVSKTTARSAEHAVKKVVAQLAEADQSGVFVAVPAKSWNPVTVTAKVERSLVVEDVKP